MSISYSLISITYSLISIIYSFMSVIYSLISIIYSLISIIYSLMSIIYSLISIIYSLRTFYVFLVSSWTFTTTNQMLWFHISPTVHTDQHNTTTQHTITLPSFGSFWFSFSLSWVQSVTSWSCLTPPLR